MAPNQESTQSELCVKGMRQEQSEKQTNKKNQNLKDLKLIKAETDNTSTRFPNINLRIETISFYYNFRYWVGRKDNNFPSILIYRTEHLFFFF